MNHVYQDYTADELAVVLDAGGSVPNVEQIRQENTVDTARARKAVPCVLDLPYGSDELQKLDIYYPKDMRGGYPVLFDIHGGGWRGGTKNGRGLPAATLVPQGVVYVTIDYGLAPKHKIAAIVDHVRGALAWTYKNVTAYGGDPNRIYVAGHSAGGHLTGMLLMEGWHATYGLPTEVIKGAIVSSGVYDMEALVHAPRGYNDELGMTLAEARAHSPYHHLPKCACPLIVAYGGDETKEFIRQSRSFAKAWRDAGLTVTEIECPGDHHFSIARTFVDTRTPLYGAVARMIGLAP